MDLTCQEILTTFKRSWSRLIKLSLVNISDAGRCSLKVARVVAFPSPKIVTSFATVTDSNKSNALRFVFRFVSEVEKYDGNLSIFWGIFFGIFQQKLFGRYDKFNRHFDMLLKAVINCNAAMD